MLKLDKIRVDHAAISGCERGRTISAKNPEFNWSVLCDRAGAYQSQYNIEVSCCGEALWSSGWVYSKKQSARYAGKMFPVGAPIDISLTIRDENGETSETSEDYFYYAQLEKWDASWICAAEDIKRRPKLFRRIVDAAPGICAAVMYVSGIGYHHVTVNGVSPDDAVMDPQWTDYTARVPYVFLADLDIGEGSNVVEIAIADGWRHIDSPFLNKHVGEQGPRFGGVPQLSAIIELRYTDGRVERILTDESWQTSYYEILESNIYDGETYDAAQSERSWTNAVICAAPGGKMEVMTLEPIREQEVYSPLSVYSPRDGVYVVDFGQNIAGVARLSLPAGMKAGQTITVRHAEFLDEDGTLYTAPLREAKATDHYIASGDSRDLEIWQPQFTYHGFRYIEIEGWSGPVTRADAEAVALYTDIESDSFFSCGSAIINAIQKNVVQTEKSNIHSVLTDCPQRDERLGWMNDATVRFEETPYNFDIGRIFPKLIRDLRDVQTINGNGAIQCTAPFFVGGNPADPVCSSYLVAGMQSLLFTGNRDIIAEIYDGYAAWEKCLLDRSDAYIVNYSYYGDWASPAYACIGEDGANSAVTPGILMSTGYSYLNCRMLARFAAEIGRTEDIGKYNELADKIAAAYLAKWYDEQSGRVDIGSQASQAFTLWLGLVPLEGREKAA
ncbi:MAG: family 78 glycoside hydrolase catalytic domain, partial [Eubacteriales bacterium]